MRVRSRLPLLVLLVLAACSRFAVHSAKDPNADLARLRTYAWLPLAEAEPADQRVLDRHIDARIRAAIGKELDAKGYRAAASGAPDFLLNYRLSTEPASAVKGAPYTARFAGGVWRGWAGVDTLYSESYDDGTLYVAVLDAQSRQMIWIGAASARLLPHVSYEKRVKRVDAAVHAILAPFPAT